MGWELSSPSCPKRPKQVVEALAPSFDGCGRLSSRVMASNPEPFLPDYAGACVSNLVPEIVKKMVGYPGADWLPEPVQEARQVVILVIDGLGWEQLQEREKLAPTLMSGQGGAISSVCPTTTSTVLTSIVTGRAPGIHGMLGYRMWDMDGVLNALRWEKNGQDARDSVDPEKFQTQPAFAANPVPAILRKEFIGTGFTRAMMQGANIVGYSTLSSIPVEIWQRSRAGDQLIYAYYDGLDRVAHYSGLGEHYEAELYTVDRLVRDTMAGLPEGVALVVTADHGQVTVGENIAKLDPVVADKCWTFSGEARMRWLHLHGGQDHEEVCREIQDRYADEAWVRTRQQVIDEGWFGPSVDERYVDRLGDIVIAPFADTGYIAPNDHVGDPLICRHGSLTSAEVQVPLLALIK